MALLPDDLIAEDHDNDSDDRHHYDDDDDEGGGGQQFEAEDIDAGENLWVVS